MKNWRKTIAWLILLTVFGAAVTLATISAYMKFGFYGPLALLSLPFVWFGIFWAVKELS